MEKYYAVYFDENINRFTIFCNKELSTCEYTSIQNHNDYNFISISCEDEKIDESIYEVPRFFVKSVPYFGYRLKSDSCFFVNEQKKDKFMYDQENKRIIYGDVGVYAYIVGDNFVDVVTGKIIPRNIVKKSVLIENLYDYRDMAIDLALSLKHLVLYSELLDEIISTFSLSYENVMNAKETYNAHLFNKYKEYEKKYFCLCLYNDNEGFFHKKTNVYAILKNGQFVDIVTDWVIPKHIISNYVEVLSLKDLKYMYNDLSYAFSHKELYSGMLTCYHGYVLDSPSFEDKSDRYIRQLLRGIEIIKFPENRIDRHRSNFAGFGSETSMTVDVLNSEEYVKVKKLVDDIRKEFT